MAYEFNGSSQYIIANTAAVTATPFTFAGWLNVDDKPSGAGGVLVSFGNETSLNRALLSAYGDGPGDPMSMLVANPSNSLTVAETTQGFTTGQFMHGAGTATGTTNVACFINGGSKGSASAAITMTTALDRTLIGVQRVDSGYATYFDGKLSEIAIWNVALTDAEITSLAKGFSPRRISPQSLVFYAPLLRNLQDLRKGLAMTAVNSPTVAYHPRVY